MTDSDQAVHLVVPAEARFLRLARLTAAGLASDLGFGVAELDDLRIAVDEACAVLLASPAAAGAQLELMYRTAGDEVVIEGSCPGDARGPVDLHPVARELLRLTADEHEIDAEGGRWRFRLVKRTNRPA